MMSLYFQHFFSKNFLIAKYLHHQLMFLHQLKSLRRFVIVLIIASIRVGSAIFGIQILCSDPQHFERKSALFLHKNSNFVMTYLLISK